jgi:hypothetical protein
MLDTGYRMFVTGTESDSSRNSEIGLGAGFRVQGIWLKDARIIKYK